MAMSRWNCKLVVFPMPKEIKISMTYLTLSSLVLRIPLGNSPQHKFFKSTSAAQIPLT